MSKICVFAGTSEGRHLVERLCGRGLEMVACVATEYGEVLLGEHPDVTIRAGRMDVDEMQNLFLSGDFQLVIDATHPYADKVTENIIEACEKAGADYLRLLRPSDSNESDGVFVENTAACVAYLENTQGNIFLTTGSKELPAYRSLKDRVYARVLPMQASLESCAECGIAPDHIIAMQGPFDQAINLAMLRMTHARYMVTKDTGGPGGYGAKIAAARSAGVQPVIIGRPVQHNGMGIDEVIQMLEKRFELRPAKKKVSLVGIGMGNGMTCTLETQNAIEQADCLIGAKRMLELVDTAGKNIYAAVLAGDIEKYIRNGSESRFAVILSGDTGFYSGARGLIEALSDMDVEVLPGIGSLQYFCSKLRRPWQDVRAVSLHGRDCDFVGEVRRNRAVFALVGGDDGIQKALERLDKAGMGTHNVYVGEHLGYPDERITSGRVCDLLGRLWNTLSVLIVENEDADRYVVTHGLPDEAFDRDETPMTKSEVRSVSISKLQLTSNAVVYDVGSGSGSVSVECALQAPHGRVYAIEMKPRAIALTRQNGEKFGLENLIVVEGRAPEVLMDLERPTHAFIGGSTGCIGEIIDLLLEKNPEIRIVVNTVTLETLGELTAIASRFDYCDISEISVTKPRKLGRYQLMTAQNPVFVFTLQNGENHHE